MTKEELKQEAEEWIIKNSKEFITNPNYSPFDYAEGIYLAGAEPREKQIQIDAEQIRALQKQNGELTDKVKELEAQNEILERRIIKAKECMKKLLYIINSEPSNYNCKGLVQDANDFIHNRTCNIRKSGNHCITEEPCIMCDN